MRLAGGICRKRHYWTEQSRISEGIWRTFSNSSGHKDGGDVRPNEEKTSYGNPKHVIYDKLRKSNSKYEEFIGLTDVQEAQEKVKRAEAVFLAARAKERQVLRDMVETREKLKDVRERLSHVDYSNTMYLQLASDQHELVNEEERRKTELEEAEDRERDSFMDLSTAMRESYEKERARVERTKNWSIIGTVIGAIIGMIGSIYMNRVRTSDIIKAVKDAGSRDLIDEKFENLSQEFDTRHDVVKCSLATIAENMTEMASALQIQNLQVMAGLVEEPFKEGSQKPVTTSASSSQGQQMHTPTLQALSDEMGSYNTALNSLVNAVTALSNAPSPMEAGDPALEKMLDMQMHKIESIHSLLAEVVTATNRVDMHEMAAKLDDVHKKLAILTRPASGYDHGSTFYEVPLEEQPDALPDWVTGVKDSLLWGSLFCCLYMFAKF